MRGGFCTSVTCTQRAAHPKGEHSRRSGHSGGGGSKQPAPGKAVPAKNRPLLKINQFINTVRLKENEDDARISEGRDPRRVRASGAAEVKIPFTTKNTFHLFTSFLHSISRTIDRTERLSTRLGGHGEAGRGEMRSEALRGRRKSVDFAGRNSGSTDIAHDGKTLFPGETIYLSLLRLNRSTLWDDRSGRET